MSDEMIRKAAMHRALHRAHMRAYEAVREAEDADAEQECAQGEGGTATAASDVPELG